MTFELERLMARAIQDPQEESEFFRALLKATVYAHTSPTDRLDVHADRIRFVQFPRPDNGHLVLPFFTDEKKARFAAGSAVRILAFKGRHLLELTRGATLMLNPNDTRCVLYPEEVDALLRTGFIARVEKITVEEETAPLVGPSMSTPPSWLIDALITAFAKFPFIQLAYIAGIYKRVEEPQQIGFLIALCGDKQYAERAIHAATVVLQPLCEQHDGPAVDMTHFDVAGEVPEWVSKFSLKPFYDRAWGARLHAGTGHTGGLSS
jgi:hypothetical protein